MNIIHSLKRKNIFINLTYWFYIAIYEISIQWIIATQNAFCKKKICNNYLLYQEINKQPIYRPEKIITKYKPWTWIS